MKDRLKSCCGWGLTVAIESLELEICMCCAILINKAEAHDIFFFKTLCILSLNV
ncbi:hypothetical protein [Blochmannia endosymbiont of Camponotus (Colobopsis) obliquus]|uniref:hypothetical protein n=1 Tax=Blochmannia endosymbiont of Camponotus (Colobopsis) obliquus TaxID=1505597 RepID=UPI000AB15BBA